MRFPRGWLLLAAGALVSGACGTGDTAETILTSTTSSSTPATTAVLTPTTTISITTKASVSLSTWSRVPHDEAVFGGTGDQKMRSVTVGGPGLVAVGWAGSRNDLDAAVWTSSDGVTWSRVPHDEVILGGAEYQVMWSVTAGGPGLVAVGVGGSVDDFDAAVWVEATED